ncbi:MAG: glycosyltransferase family 4 protein [Bacteroidota bacterium]
MAGKKSSLLIMQPEIKRENKIKVVMTIANSSYTPYFSYFARQAYQENNIEFTFVFLHFEEPKIIHELKNYNAVSYWYHFDYRKEKKIQYLKLVWKMYRLFKKIKPDVVHTHLFDDSLPGLMAAKWAGVKKRIITKQDTMFHYLFAKKGMKYDIKNNNNATHIVPCSEESREFIIEHEKADTSKIKVIHHGVDETEYTSATKEEIKYIRDKFNPHNKIMIGTVSRLVASKGYDYIIPAMALLAKKRNDLLFVAAGAGPHEQRLKKLVEDHGISSSFIFAGHIDKKFIPAFYQSLSIYVHASIYEPFGFVIPEAIFNGVPVITTPTGASRDALKHMESACFVPVKNTEALAEAIDFMAGRDNSAMAEEARKIARKMYTLQQMWAGYRSLYLDE